MKGEREELPKRKYPRLKEYDYSRIGAYFVTICSKDKRKAFGEIIDQEVILNGTGKIVEQHWQQISKHFPNVELESYVVMPNHLHGIIVIESRVTACRDRDNTESFGKPVRGSLSTIIRSFKSAVTRCFNQQGKSPFNLWQRSFYEHVIRNEADMARVCEYIHENPFRWNLDENYVE